MRLRDLTIEEKIKLLVGSSDGNQMRSEGLNGKVYQIKMNDGPIGPHCPKPPLWMPSTTSLASSWNEEIVEKYVNAISDICIINDVDMLLAPAMNIKRVPLCGRNFEYYSEDPYLTGVLTKKYIETLQSRGIAATPKHFCCNSREFTRLYSFSEVDQRALREIYTRAFEMAIEANPWSLMCSYNGVNGCYVAENKAILKDLLRDKLHFKNMLVSDWGAVRNRALALKASLDLQMPYQNDEAYRLLKEGLESGIITEEDINISLDRIEELINRIQEAKKTRFVKYSDEERHQIALEACEEGIVLLKNEDKILPLKNGTKISVMGLYAREPELCGGGSCNLADDPNLPPDKSFNIQQKYVDDLLKEQLPDSEVRYVMGYYVYQGFGLRSQHIHTPIVIRDAKECDVVVLFVGTNRAMECEGFDRDDLKLPSIHLDIIHKVAELNKNVIVVIEAGSVIDVSEFKDKVKGIIYSGFGGEAMNQAIANILTGKTCPSGKLAETFISSVDVNPYIAPRGEFENEVFKDSIYVGYRLYETQKIPVEYPFGHGLSYTQFEYSDLQVNQLGEFEYEIAYKIKNVGKVKGKEINQLYIRDLGHIIDRPDKELKGFNKVELNPGETKEIKLRINKQSFAYFDVDINDWKANKNDYEILIGASCQDIRLNKIIKI